MRYTITLAALLLSLTRSIQKLKSLGLPVVVMEETAKPCALFDGRWLRPDHFQRNDKAILQSLMAPLRVVMRYEFSKGVSQCILTKEDHLIQTAFFDATDEAFGVRIQIR